MRKAFIVTKQIPNHNVGDILRIAEAKEMDSWKGIHRSWGEAVEIPTSITHDLIEAKLIPEQAFVAGIPESWTDGTTTVYNVNDIPTLTDANGNAYLDPNFIHIPEVPQISFIPEHWKIVEAANATQQLRQKIIDRLSALREPLLREADIEINKLIDLGLDISLWSAYRQALRDVTEPYKKVNGGWKVATDSIDLKNFTWPVKP